MIFCCGIFISCDSGSSGDDVRMDHRTSIKLKQYMVQGRKLYRLHCSNCHQEDGSGLRELIPPLKKADYLHDNTHQVVCIIQHGIDGELVVNGISYNQPMPANERLTPLEIAEIVTYVYNTFGHSEKLVTAKEVDRMLEECTLK